MPEKIAVRQSKVNATNYGQIGEILKPLRPSMQKGFADSPAGALPVLGNYDVIVLGGGTAGASAGISAARQGAKNSCTGISTRTGWIRNNRTDRLLLGWFPGRFYSNY